MKIVSREVFLLLPSGTIYARGKQWYFDSICVKHDSLLNDWVYTNPSWVDANDSGEADERLEDSLKTGASYPCEKDAGRDGRFDAEDIFMVFERDDLVWLRDQISAAISLCGAEES